MIPLLAEFQLRAPALFEDVGQEKNETLFDTLYNLYQTGTLSIDTILDLFNVSDQTARDIATRLLNK